jgi:colanic acid biosynthesis glycosyl transferase WcaI
MVHVHWRCDKNIRGPLLHGRCRILELLPFNRAIKVMHVLLINQFFWPDTAATGQLLTDVTRGIDPKIHAVTVLCGTPDYGAVDMASPPRVEIIRSGGVAFSRGKIGRVVSYASFFAVAAVRCVRGPKPALVLTLTTPPLISLLGTLLKSLRGSRHFIWEMDLYPDIAVDLNVIKPRSVVTRLIGTLADFSRRRADRIIALGNDMKARLIARGIPEQNIFVVENWADGCEIVPAPFEEGPLVVHYSGTFGLAHEEHTITEAMRQLRDDSRFRFVFAGGGARRERLEAFCRAEGIGTAEFRPYARRSELGRSLAEGHVGLVTQIPETMGAIVPSKTYGIMAAGRPVLYIGPQGATPARVLEWHGCGWRVEPGDTAGLIRLLRRLEQDRGLVREAGARARCAFEKYYDRPIGVARILSILGLSDTSRPTTAPVNAASTI